MKVNLISSLNQIYTKLSEATNNPENLANRLFRASLPFFNFYGPFNQCSTLMSQGIQVVSTAQKAYTDIGSLTKSYNENGFTKESGMKATQAVISVAFVVAGLVNYRLGMIISSGSDTCSSLYSTITKLKNKEYNQAGLEFYKSMTHGLRVVAIIHPAGLELNIASKAFQIILDLGISYKEFRAERYIETISNLGLAFIRSYQLLPQLELLNKKWRKNYPDESIAPKPLSIAQGEKKIERRAAIDVGSGGTKVFIADVNVETNEIINVVFDKSFSVAYQASLENSANGTFDEMIQAHGINTFKEIKDLLHLHQVNSITAIATEAFRKADNGAEFAKNVNVVTGIPLKVISQEQEGIIAYNSALAVNKGNPDKTIVWDIGTGSFQITMKGEEGEYKVFMGGMGSVPFKNHIIDNIQKKNPEEILTPNPMSPEDYKETGKFARSLARKATRDVKAMIKSPDVTIVGIGRLFYNSVRPLVTEDNMITRKGLRNYIRGALDKSDGDLNNPYSHVDVPNCIQVLEVMKALHIQKISAVNTTTTKGLIIASAESFSNWSVS